jgi:hypothetical protein
MRGIMLNTDLFGVMMNAYGWKPSLPVSPRPATSQ